MALVYRPSARIRSGWRHRCGRILICARALKGCQKTWHRNPVNSAGLTPLPFILAFNLVVFPVISEFVAGFLSHHPLLNPFLASAVLSPVFPGAVKGSGRVAHVPNAFITCFGKPEFNGFRFGAWDRLNKP